jgi:hypothetical protein
MLRSTPLFSVLLYGTVSVLVQSSGQAQSVEDVAKVATAISVKIESGDKAVQGSGVILQKQGDLYTVLTAAHVVKSGNAFSLTTAIDNQSHAVMATAIKRSTSDIDLAVIQFRSDKNYKVAKIGNSNLLQQGMELYVAGYPAPTATITRSILVFREGRVTANADRAFSKGYSLVYSNSTLPGMSGGAVLNKAGELVAIHGQGDRSADKQKTDFNLGIPISRFGEVSAGMGVQLEIARVLSMSTPRADNYYISANNKKEAGDYPGALADFDLAIGIDPKYADAYCHRGTLKAWYLDDLYGGLGDYNQAIFLNPKYATAYYNRAFLNAERIRDFKGALADYDRAIALDPKKAAIYVNRGNLKAEHFDDFRGALADHNQAIALNPNFANAYYNRGVLKKLKLNDLNGAIADFRLAAKLFRQQGKEEELKDALRQLRKLKTTE